MEINIFFQMITNENARPYT